MIFIYVPTHTALPLRYRPLNLHLNHNLNRLKIILVRELELRVPHSALGVV